MKLSKDPFFLSTFVIGSIITVGSAIAIGFSGIGALGVCFKPECFTNFLTYYAFPFKAATATAAILGIVAMLHKSKQTAKQIALSTQQIQTTINQNKYLNYFNHLNHFKDQLSNLTFKELKPTTYYGAYKIIFPNNSPQSFNHLGTVDLLNVEFHTYLSKQKDMMNTIDNVKEITDFNTALLIKDSHDKMIDNLEEFLNHIGFSLKDYDSYSFDYQEAIHKKDRSYFVLTLPDEKFYKNLVHDIELISHILLEASQDHKQIALDKLLNIFFSIGNASKCYDLITDWAEEDYLSLVDN